MKIAFLNRISPDEKQTLGIMSTNIGSELWVSKSLELGWHDNKNDISCIPIGSYLCRWTRSTRLSNLAGHDIFTYEVVGVPNRAGIRIHSANYFFQLKGCIALGSSTKDINSDGQLDVIHSGATVKRFNEIMNREDFTLIVTESYKIAA